MAAIPLPAHLALFHMQNQNQWTRKRKLILMGYLTPSLNRLLHKHWTVAHKAKEEAKWHLTLALRESAC